MAVKSGYEFRGAMVRINVNVVGEWGGSWRRPVVAVSAPGVGHDWVHARLMIAPLVILALTSSGDIGL